MVMYAVKCLLVCAVLIVASCSQEQSTLQHLLRLKQRGHAKNCGPKGSHLNVTWTPEIVTIGQDMKIYVNMTTATTFSEGSTSIKIYAGNSTEGEPGMDDNLFYWTCQDLIKYIPSLKCPIEKRTPISFAFKQKTMFLPSGEYSTKIEVTNKAGEMFACVEFTVTIKAVKKTEYPA